MSQEEIILATLGEISDPGSKGLSINLEDGKLELFIVKKDSQIKVYKNSCPHTHGPLDLDNNHIQCANHGAMFEINSGLCIYGPCKAESLTALPFTIRDDSIFLIL